MKVLFIYPNINAQIGFNYGISYISGFLKKHGIDVHLLNINEKLGYPLDLERIKKDILAIRPDIIGFSVLTNQYKYALEIAGSIKGYLNVPVIFGGIHPTMDPLGTLSEKCVDYICVGEGEEAFLELLQKGDPRGIRNIGHKEGGGTVLEPLRPYTDITKLPFKDYEIFDFQRMTNAKDGWVGLTASRGCPFRCTYCLNHKIMGLYKDHGHLPRQYLRRHTVDEMIYEIEYLVSRYKGIRMFIFDDDIFTFDKKWLREFTGQYKKITDIGFVCNAHAKVFDEETAESLKEAGCRIVKFGLESGSDRIRRGVLHRYMSNKDIVHAFDVAHKAGLHTSAFVMVGLPHETRADIMETVDLLARIQPGRFRWSLFFPFVGTKAYSIAERSGQIDFEKMRHLDNFTDETCMVLGDGVDLLVDKVKTMFCTFVNGYANIDKKYSELVKLVEEADEKTWQQEKDRFLKREDEINKEADEKGKAHYAVKYNPFMGVRSDWEDDSISA
ncbi:MAG: B12-binding domain-containing radical SAM protein [Syntrophorhabdaceae bacterium]|nr:B12-binding domain-containing radical SAM protein [Syntrophorhabdaceae bacterium]